MDRLVTSTTFCLGLFCRSGCNPIVELVLLASSTLLCGHGLQLFLCRCGFLDLGVGAAALGLVFHPPGVTLARGAVHAPLDEAKIGRLVLARPIAFPDVGAVAVDFIVKRVVNGNLIVAVVVEGVG